MKKTTNSFLKTVAVSFVALFLLVSLAGCSGDDKTKESSTEVSSKDTKTTSEKKDDDKTDATSGASEKEKDDDKTDATSGASEKEKDESKEDSSK